MRHGGAPKRLLSERHLPAIGQVAERVAESSDAELRGHTARLRGRLSAGEPDDELLAEAFAVAGEAFWRVCGHRCSPDDLRAALALRERSVVEVQDPDTAAAAVGLAVHLRALDGRGVHVLAHDSAPRTSEVWRFLGLTVASLTEDLDDEERRAAYAADVTVGPPDQFCYDYLADNQVSGPGERVQRDLRHAVVTEADVVLLVPRVLNLLIGGEVTSSMSMGEYLRLYPHLAAVTATAGTEAEWIERHYDLTVGVVTAPERPARRDHPDLVYWTTEFKLQALVEAVVGHHAAGRPVLIRSNTPGDLARLGELLAARGVAATSPPSRRPLAHAGRPGVVTLLGELVPDREVVPGGDLDWLAEEEVLASGLERAGTAAATWQEAVADARRRLLPAWTADRRRVIDAGGVVVLGAELLESAWVEARTRNLVGERGDCRFFVSMDEIAASWPGWVNRISESSPEPIPSWLIAKGLGRVRRKYHQRVAAAYRTAFDRAAVDSGFRERFHAERRRLVEGPDPVAAAITMIGSDEWTEPGAGAGAGADADADADAGRPGGGGTADQVRSGARLILDEEWARCVQDLLSLRDDPGHDDPEHDDRSQDSVAGYRRTAQERFETMRRNVRERLAGLLSDLRDGQRDRQTVRRGWYYERGTRSEPWTAFGDPRSP